MSPKKYENHEQISQFFHAKKLQRLLAFLIAIFAIAHVEE